MPKPGHCASAIDSLMPAELGEKLAQESRRLLDPVADLKEMPNAYWDEALIQDEEKYAQFVDKLLHAGLFELCLEIDEEVGLSFCHKSDGSLRLLVDARRASRHFKRPPKVDLASPAG